jgi:hypothetical protein
VRRGAFCQHEILELNPEVTRLQQGLQLSRGFSIDTGAEPLLQRSGKQPGDEMMLVSEAA